MNAKVIQKISQSVYTQFPEIAGAAPKVSPNRLPSAKSLSTASTTFLLTFSGSVRSVQGKTISRTVRVTADENGKILKISTSR